LKPFSSTPTQVFPRFIHRTTCALSRGNRNATNCLGRPFERQQVVFVLVIIYLIEDANKCLLINSSLYSAKAPSFTPMATEKGETEFSQETTF
jgi:hypothetical protein